MKHAFKEWAAICRALAEGKQALILRKGGIEEIRDGFEVKHTRFWLFPTYTHQQQAGIKQEARPLLELAEAEKPPEGMIRISHFAEAAGAYHVCDLAFALVLDHLHVWSEETVRARFAYRRPGIFVIPVRVHKSAEVFELPDTPYYQGCRSWLELEEDLPSDGAVPVLDDRTFDDLIKNLSALLNPTALA